MYEIYLRFQHDCPYSDLSRKFPAAKFALWDNFRREFLDARSNDRRDWPRINRELQAFAEHKGSRILRKTSEGKSYQFMIMTCACVRRGSTLDLIMGSDCLFVLPIIFQGGWETYHVIAFDKRAAGRLVEKFGSRGKAEIESQRLIDIGTVDQSSVMPLVNPLSNLTSMQLNALATSMALGYYRQPRRTSTGKIAAALKVPRTTFQEHRKKAESKLMTALTPYVLTYVGGQRAQ